MSIRECAYIECGAFFEPAVHNQQYHSPECKRGQENIRRRRELVSDITAAVAPSYFDADLEERLEFLRKENRRLSNLATKHKNNADEVTKAVYNAARDAFSSMDLKPINPPKARSYKNQPLTEVANPVLSDFQIGKRTETYNSEVCKERIESFGDQVLGIVDDYRSWRQVDRAHVYLLGDIVEGEDVFPGQAYEIDSSLYKQITNGVDILVDFLRRMLSEFETVHVAGVIGNHGWLTGRTGRYNPETNMDRLLYKLVEMFLKDEPRITFDTPDGTGETRFYTVDYIGDYGTLLIHGDQLSVPTSIHSYYKKILGWKTSGIKEPFDSVIMGHYHQNTKATLGNTVVRIVGSPESDNTYAQERLGVMGRPSQHFQFVRPDFGVTMEYDVYLD